MNVIMSIGEIKENEFNIEFSDEFLTYEDVMFISDKIIRYMLSYIK